jgi:hypothetical protein
VIIARVSELDRPGVRVKKGRIYTGGPFGRCTQISVSGTRDSLWSRVWGQRVNKIGVGSQRGLEVLDDNDDREVTHALVFLELMSEFIFSIDPSVTLSPATQVLWEDQGAQLLLAPVDSEFSVSTMGVWSPSIGGVSDTSGPPVFARRVMFYRVGQHGIVHHYR